MSKPATLPTEGETSYATVYFFMLSLGFAPCTISFYLSAPLGVLLAVGWNSRNMTIIESLFFGSLLWGSCRLCRLRERFPTLRCIFWWCSFNRTFHLLNLYPSAPLGALLSIDTKQSNEKPKRQGLLRCISALTASEMLAMEQPLLCFHPCQNKNTAQNPLASPTFHRLPKIRFLVRRIWKPNFPFAGKKGKYRLPMRL